MMLLLIGGLLFITGCPKGYQPIIGEYRFLQPDKPIAKPDQAQVNWIIQDMGELDKTDEIYPNATKPGPEDWVYIDEDYVIAAMDELQISVMDLYADGMETVLPRQVSDSGFIDLPQLDERIEAAGLTAKQLTEEIKNAYSKDILRDPQVSVAVVVRRQQTFSILGAVARPGTYPFPKKDMHVLDAIAMAGDIYQQDIETIYVIRQAPALRKSQAGPLPKANQPAVDTNDDQSKVISDPSRRFLANASKPSLVREKSIYQLSETVPGLKDAPTTAPAGTVTTTVPATNPTTAPTTRATATAPTESGKSATSGTAYRWVYQNGEWVKVEKKTSAEKAVSSPAPVPLSESDKLSPPKPGQSTDSVTPVEKNADDPFGWAKMEKNDLVRVIAINLPKLKQGDYRQNIVIRSNDTVLIPMLPVGEFYIMGEVYRPGVYSLTGRKVTIKMALAAAGNLGPMSWPANSVLIRRVGKNQEQTFPLNIELIMQGQAPDMYLKKNDIIAVGTHWSTSFLAVLRNAFRMTYGFGFIYDRNFSDPLPESLTPSSRRFKEW